MFFFRHLFLGNGFYADTRFSIEGWRHWLAALVTWGWWGAVTWASWWGWFFANLAIIQLGELAQRADLTPAEENQDSVVALAVLAIVGLVVATITALDITLRLCVEVCLWVASSAWRFEAVQHLSARFADAFERKILRRTPEWEVELVYPAPRHRAVLAPSGLAQQIGRERAQVLRER